VLQFLAKYYSLVSWLHLSILLDTSDTSNTVDTSSIRNTDAGSPYFAIFNLYSAYLSLSIIAYCLIINISLQPG